MREPVRALLYAVSGEAYERRYCTVRGPPRALLAYNSLVIGGPKGLARPSRPRRPKRDPRVIPNREAFELLANPVPS